MYDIVDKKEKQGMTEGIKSFRKSKKIFIPKGLTWCHENISIYCDRKKCFIKLSWKKNLEKVKISDSLHFHGAVKLFFNASH